jgi:predicted Mrr-cat superfamily restriction endonuclease
MQHPPAIEPCRRLAGRALAGAGQQRDLSNLEQLFAHYDQLDENVKAELPPKQIWTVTAQEEELL